MSFIGKNSTLPGLKSIDKEKWYLIAVFFWSLLYAVARFPGIETHSGYFGMAYGLIHPGSFGQDINANFHPAMISWYSIMVKIFGEAWLDDRLNLFFYFILTLLSYLAVGKVAELFGMRSILGRLAVIGIAAGHHMFADNVPQIIDVVCYRPSTYAYPIGFWLAYFLLRGGSHRAVVYMAMLIVSMSFKNGWFPAFTGLLIIGREAFGWSWRNIFLVCLAGLTVIFAGHYFLQIYTGSLADTVWVFDTTLATTENSEANPWLDGLGAWVLLSLMGVMALVCRRGNAVEKRFSIVCAASFIIYYLSGFYYSLAPDAMKIVLFAAMAVNRSTWWVQVMIFIVLGAWLVRGIEQGSPWKKAIMILGLILLFLFPVFEYPAWGGWFSNGNCFIIPPIVKKCYTIVILYLVLAGVVWSLRVARGMKLTQRDVLVIACVPLILAATLSGLYKLNVRKAAIADMFRYGIAGDSRGAKWRGINEYFRQNTTSQESVMAFSGSNLRVDPSIKIRSGRGSAATNHPIAFYFSAEKRKKSLKVYEILDALEVDLKACNIAEIRRKFALIGKTDYLVIPENHACDLSPTGYTRVTAINNFNIWKRASGQENGK